MKTSPLPGEKTVTTFLALLLAGLITGGFLGSCKNDMETIRSLDFVDTLPDLTAREVEIIYSEKARVQVKLISPLLVQKEEEEPLLVFPEGFTVYFYDSLMNLQSTITADYGISYEKKKLMEARHNVVVQNLEKGETLNTEELFWDREKAVIYSEKFVKLTNGDQVITGDGITSREPFREIDILNPKGLIEIREEPGDE